MHVGLGPSQELVTLQTDLERNNSIILQLGHEIRLATTSQTAAERAQRAHLDALRAELRAAASEAALYESYSSSPKVSSTRVAEVEKNVCSKKKELEQLQRELATMERVLKQFIHDGNLQLADLFDVHESDEDRIALDMVLDRRGH
jgi:hypothetical protein